MSASNRSPQRYPYDDDLPDIDIQRAIQASLQANARSRPIFPTQPVASSSRITIEGDERIITPSPSIEPVSVPSSPSSSSVGYPTSVPTSPSSSSASYTGTESVLDSPLSYTSHIGMSDAEMMTASPRPSLGSAGERLMSPSSRSARTRHHSPNYTTPVRRSDRVNPESPLRYATHFPETEPLSPTRVPPAPRSQPRTLSPEMTTTPPIVTPVRRQGPSDDSWNDSPVPSAPQSPRSPSDGLSHRTIDQPRDPFPYESYPPANQNIGSSPSQSPVTNNSRTQWLPVTPSVTTSFIPLQPTPPSSPMPPTPLQAHPLITNISHSDLDVPHFSISTLLKPRICVYCPILLLPSRTIARFEDSQGIPLSYIPTPAPKIEGFEEGCLFVRCTCDATYCRGCGYIAESCPGCPNRDMLAIFEVLRLFDIHYLRFFANEEPVYNEGDKKSVECQFLGLYAAAGGCTANIMAFIQTLETIEHYAMAMHRKRANAQDIRYLLERSFLCNVVRSCLSHAYLHEHVQENYANLFLRLFGCLKSLCKASPNILASNWRIRSSPGIGTYFEDMDGIRWFDEDVTPTLLRMVETYHKSAHPIRLPGKPKWFPDELEAQYQRIISLCSSGHA